MLCLGEDFLPLLLLPRFMIGASMSPQLSTWRYPGGSKALNWEREQEAIVDTLAEKLDARLREWKAETAAEARERIIEVIELADHDILDIARARASEQEVLDLLDEPPTR